MISLQRCVLIGLSVYARRVFSTREIVMRIAIADDSRADSAHLTKELMTCFTEMGYEQEEPEVYDSGEALLAVFSAGLYDLSAALYRPGTVLSGNKEVFERLFVKKTICAD